MLTFPWALFAVLIGFFLPVSVVVRSSAQVFHDRALGFTHTLNIYRLIKAILVIPVLALIGPTAVFLLFGPGDPEAAIRVVNFLGTIRGVIVTGSLLLGILLIDVFRPRMQDQLTRLPISELRRTSVQFRNDTAVLGIVLGVAAVAALLG